MWQPLATVVTWLSGVTWNSLCAATPGHARLAGPCARSGPAEAEDEQDGGERQAHHHPQREEQRRVEDPVAEEPADATVEDHAAQQVADRGPAVSPVAGARRRV